MTKPKNINDPVWVRLNEHGEKMWAEYWRETEPSGVPGAIRSANTEADGRIRFQLWELMNIFGRAMYMGNPHTPFQKNDIWFEF